MSSESIDLLWGESINTLKKLIQEEEETSTRSKPVSIKDAQNYFAKLYVRYSLVLKYLGNCYDYSIQPQKRLDIKSTMEYVICRVINLRHLLVKWAPLNPDVISKDGSQKSFPWEYVDLSEMLKELQVSPSQIEFDKPSFFADTAERENRLRNDLVETKIREIFGNDFSPEESLKWRFEKTASSSPVKTSSCSNGGASKSPDHQSQNQLLPDDAATLVQTSFRAYVCKKNIEQRRTWSNNFIGMSNSNKISNLSQLENDLVDIQDKRRQEQNFCKESYTRDLHNLKDVVRQEEGFQMQMELREERIKWITDHVINRKSLPDSFQDFYIKDSNSNEEAHIKLPVDNKSGPEKTAKSKPTALPEIEIPILAGPQSILDSLQDIVDDYEEKWRGRNVGPDRIKLQYHDSEMAKDLIIREEVRNELTKEVEEKLLRSVLKLKEMQKTSDTKSKSKKAGKGKAKKGKAKKLGGGKKEKSLPGAKLSGMKEMGVKDMLHTLIQYGFVHVPKGHKLVDLVGTCHSVKPIISNMKSKVRRELCRANIVALAPVSETKI